MWATVDANVADAGETAEIAGITSDRQRKGLCSRPSRTECVHGYRVAAGRMCVGHCDNTSRRAGRERTLKVSIGCNIDARRIGRRRRRRDRCVAAQAD